MPEQTLYEMLGVEKTASQAEIKKSYYKLALLWHPDRNPEPEATAKFQALQRIYDVLSDPIKRKLYDNTGSLQECEDMMEGGSFNGLYAAFREATQVTEEDLESFSVEYRGSAEERNDLLHWYNRFKGDMTQVFQWLMLSRPDVDSHRFRESLEQAIADGEIKPTKAYKQWSAAVAATPRPAGDPLAPPKKAKKQQAGADDSMALVAAIQHKKKSAFNGMLASLEAKYAQPAKAKGNQSSSKAATNAGASKGSKGRRQKKTSSTDSSSDGIDADKDTNIKEPTEEEFAAARARVEARAAAAATAKAKQAKKQTKLAAGGKVSKQASAAAAPAKRQKRA